MRTLGVMFKPIYLSNLQVVLHYLVDLSLRNQNNMFTVSNIGKQRENLLSKFGQGCQGLAKGGPLAKPWQPWPNFESRFSRCLPMLGTVNMLF